MSNAKRLGMAGFSTTAITYGPARVAYGLFLPYFREDFGLSTTLLGLIASGAFVGFLLAAVGLFVSKIGPRIPVVVGLLSATLGMLLVALANDAWILAAGVVLAGMSAGWTWSPYNDTADYMVEQGGQGRVLAAVSTGTTLGILATGLTALLVGEDWRVGWIAFTFAAGVVTIPNILILPGRTHDDPHGETDSVPPISFRDGWS